MHSVNLLAFPLFDRLQRFFNGPHPQVEKHEVFFTIMKPAPSPKVVPVSRLSIAPGHIPNEIVLKILESAYDPRDVSSTNDLLMNSALVSKDWSVLAQKLLFRHVTLSSQAAFHSLSNALTPSTPRGRMLADAVIRLRVIIDHNQPNCLSQQSFAHAVTLCPRLSELDVSLFGKGAPGHDVVGSPALARMQRPAPSFDNEILSVLRSGTSITRLCFSNWTDNSAALSQLLDIWPSLKALEIRGTPPSIPPHASSTLPCVLNELRINCQKPPSMEFLKWLLQNSKGSLRSVHADRESCSEVLSHVLREHADSLDSVAIPSCPTRDTVVSLMRCQDLRLLRIEDARVPMVLCKTLPLTLQHVALGVHRDTDMQPLLQLISEGAGLASVALHLWKGGERHQKLDTVKIACAMQGVELSVVKDIREFRSTTC